TVVRAILQKVSPEVPILIHSMNPGRADTMKTALEKSGFSVTRLPMGDMSKDAFLEWLEDVREGVEESDIERN
ncbi:MAG: hypothetical protein RQ767_05225, partial [Thermovirgaceae bacterium]|nr:hypothetical protein [Thermovirgaceae bacterium]